MGRTQEEIEHEQQWERDQVQERIANALERIADLLEKSLKAESYSGSDK